MLTFLYVILGAIVFTFFTWGMYLSVMNLMRVKDTLTIETKCFAYPLAVIGVLADFLYNVIVGTVLFLELPQELLLTKRLKRHLNDDNFRGAMSRWFCRHLLDPFDPKGTHCGKKPQ
jgi:hypothetical protein